VNEVYRDIEQHIPYLRRYAGSLTRDPAAADDLLQDCVVNALSKSHLYRPGSNLRAWLFTILRNQHISGIRRHARTGIAVDPDDAVPALATRPNQEHSLAVDVLAAALRTLPDEQRVLIELISLEGLSYDDVARRHGLAVGTVKSRVSRGRSQLRKVLDGSIKLDEPAGRPRAEDGVPHGLTIGGPGTTGRSADRLRSNPRTRKLAA